MAKKRYTQADHRRKFGGEVSSYYIVESAQYPGEIQINQYSSRLVGTLTPAKARELAANLIAAAEAIEADQYDMTGMRIDAEIPVSDCKICSGELVPLGTLGTRTHYRCRRCGLDHRL